MKKVLLGLLACFMFSGTIANAYMYEYSKTCVIEESRDRVKVTYTATPGSESFTIARPKVHDKDHVVAQKITINCGDFVVKIQK